MIIAIFFQKNVARFSALKHLVYGGAYCKCLSSPTNAAKTRNLSVLYGIAPKK